MAIINLLTSSFEGKLGEAYGVKQYNKHFAKAIPFSHTPFNEKQKKVFSAFLIRTMAGNSKNEFLKETRS